MVRRVTFDIRPSTLRARHSTADSRRSIVARRFAAVGRRLSNVFQPTITETYQPDQVSVVVQVEIDENAVTTQEGAGTTQENGAIARKHGVVAPKEDEVAPKNAVKPDGDAVKNAVKTHDATLRDSIIEKCAELYLFLKADPRRTILNAVDVLKFSPRSVAQYLNLLKQANVLEHIGPTNGGTWKFLI